ncbi:hypothetical protein AX16_008105 [Volvariella volvacea WC 439]|nr:hypothetical protein AX16_008105 [Volvariella volvacea WC 439]
MVKKQDTSISSVFFLVFASICMLLVAVSAPIHDGVRMFRLRASINGFRHYVDYGLWGYCIPEASRIGYWESKITQECSKTQLGWEIDEVVVEYLSAPQLRDAITKGHTSVLIMLPVALILTIFSLALAVILFLARRTGGSTVGSGVGVRTMTSLIIFNTFVLLFNIAAWFTMFSVGWVIDEAVEKVSRLELKWDNIAWLVGITVVAHIWNIGFLFIFRKQVQAHVSHHNDGGAHAHQPAIYAPDVPDEPAPPYTQATGQQVHNEYMYPPSSSSPQVKDEFQTMHTQNVKKELDGY